MKRYVIIATVVPVTLIFISFNSNTRHAGLDPASASFPIHPLLVSDQEAFTKAIKNAHPFTTNQLRGGIIPHHLVASDNIAIFFATMKQFSYKTIILIGPNHYEKGNFDVLTSKIGWDSPYGIVEPDTEVV